MFESCGMSTTDDIALLTKAAPQLAMRLRDLRRESGLSQEAVAHTAGISTYTYQKFEKGESKPGTLMNPRLSTLLALADVFCVSVGQLLGETDSFGQTS